MEHKYINNDNEYNIKNIIFDLVYTNRRMNQNKMSKNQLIILININCHIFPQIVSRYNYNIKRFYKFTNGKWY